MNTTTSSIEWARPELLADANAWAAYRTVMAILADRGATPTNDAIREEAQAGRSWALAQPDAICDVWAPAYARVIKALA